MTTTQPDRLDQVKSRLDKIELAIEALTEQVKESNQKLTEQVKESNQKLTEQVKESNLKIDLYQKASQQVVNLAFGLLSVAALAIIVPAVTMIIRNQ